MPVICVTLAVLNEVLSLNAQEFDETFYGIFVEAKHPQ